jgi:hypothetical protein
MEGLTDSQAAALEQLQAITNGADIDVSIGVLESVDWDVQVLMFDVSQQTAQRADVRVASCRRDFWWPTLDFHPGFYLPTYTNAWQPRSRYGDAN